MEYQQWLSIWKRIMRPLNKSGYKSFKGILLSDFNEGLSPAESVKYCLAGKGEKFASCGIPDSAIENWGALLERAVSY